MAELVLLSFQNMTNGSHVFNRTTPEMREGNLYVMEKKDVTTSDAEYDVHGWLYFGEDLRVDLGECVGMAVVLERMGRHSISADNTQS